MSRRFVGEKLAPVDGWHDAIDGREPPLPVAFAWSRGELRVVGVARTWFEIETPTGDRAVIYFDRAARRSDERWWLYTIESPDR